MMEVLRQDTFGPFRSWRRRPALTAVVVLTLAIGISVTSVVSAVVDAMLLAPHPFAAATISS